MTEPKRIQRQRTKGWKMPENTISVTRPGRYGNPYLVGPDGTAQECVDKFRQNMPDFAKRAYMQDLRGKNLACWCKLGDPCHADVLLEIANASPPVEQAKTEVGG